MRTIEQIGDAALRTVGLVVWLVVGSPTWLAVVRGGATSTMTFVWFAAYVAFAILLWLATDSARARRMRVAALASQSMLALALAVIGMPHFEGALLALVAAQTVALVPFMTALAWGTAQAVPLFFIVLPSHGATGAAKATGEYLAFAVFATLVGFLREREAAARRELARERATLLGTQSLLADGARAHERFRLAREVHDAIGHGLTAASVNLELAARTNDAAALDAARAAVRGTLGDLRGLVSAMRTPSTVDIGVALRVLCAGVREPVVELVMPERFRMRDGARAHVVFRAVQEGLTNAIKHGHAKHVRVEVAASEHEVVVTLVDDGIGAANVAAGSGLEGLRERLAQVGGEVDVETRPHAGFTLRMTMPLEDPE